MTKVESWDGVIVTFRDVHMLKDWISSEDDDLIQKIEYLCYACFQKLSLGRRRLRKTQRAYDHVTWFWSTGRSLPMYTAFCSDCQSLLDIQTEYCCESHQVKLPQSSRDEVLKIMAEQITLDTTLCPYFVAQANLRHKFSSDEIRNLITIGKENIKLFGVTASGVMLQSMIGRT
jgi:hypothetical protein